jgi:hypothetical protein
VLCNVLTRESTPVDAGGVRLAHLFATLPFAVLEVG